MTDYQRGDRGTADQARRQHAAAQAQAYDAVDAQYVQTLAQYRALALAAPGSPPAGEGMGGRAGGRL
jgi:hypothetical protein